MPFYRRTRGTEDRWVRWKMALFGLAAVAFFFGFRLELRWLVWVAVALLVVAVVLRFAPRRREDETDT